MTASCLTNNYMTKINDTGIAVITSNKPRKKTVGMEKKEQ